MRTLCMDRRCHFSSWNSSCAGLFRSSVSIFRRRTNLSFNSFVCRFFLTPRDYVKIISFPKNSNSNSLCWFWGSTPLKLVLIYWHFYAFKFRFCSIWLGKILPSFVDHSEFHLAYVKVLILYLLYLQRTRQKREEKIRSFTCWNRKVVPACVLASCTSKATVKVTGTHFCRFVAFFFRK